MTLLKVELAVREAAEERDFDVLDNQEDVVKALTSAHLQFQFLGSNVENPVTLSSSVRWVYDKCIRLSNRLG